ncbi:hypothetical protein, partial [Streptomyces sp. ADI96-02]|uniref:hypothetical protein n=2 Tax=unclassified Streptomyces TaxID=2593676 RepID=UPI0013DE166C
ADPAIGAYHHYNGEKPEASLITRYGATAAPSTLPLKNPYGGYLAPENGGSIAKLNQPDLFAPTAHVQTQLVNSVGTYVSSPTLATS